MERNLGPVRKKAENPIEQWAKDLSRNFKEGIIQIVNK